jgi:hypothetical protein
MAVENTTIFLCRYLISSLILMFVIFCCVYLWAGEMVVIFISALEGVSRFLRHCSLKYTLAWQLCSFLLRLSYLELESRLALSIFRSDIPVV